MLFHGIEIDPEQLMPMANVIAGLRENGENHSALVEIRRLYEQQFGEDLCWYYPYLHGYALGCTIIAVCEGYLYLPYNQMDEVDLELYDIDAAMLLTLEQIEELESAARRQWEYSQEGLAEMKQHLAV